MRTYFLRTDRLGFGIWTAADLPLARKLWGNPAVTRLISADGTFSEADIESRLQTEIDQGKRFGVQYWPIFRQEDGALAGCCGLRPYGDAPHAFEFGVHLLPAYHGSGLASEAGKGVIAYAKDTLKAHALHAGHHPDNAASRRMLERLGFVYDQDSYYAPTGRMHPTYHHPDFPAH